MKAIFICHKSYTGLSGSGGAETFAHTLMTTLISEGWECAAVTFGRPPLELEVDGVKVIRVKSTVGLERIVGQYDLILTHLGGTGPAKEMKRLFPGKPWVQVIHNSNNHSVGFLANGTDMAVYNSEWIRDFHEAVKHNTPVVQEWQYPGGKAIGKRRGSSEWPHIVVHPPAVGEYLGTAKPDGKITLVNLVENKGPDILYALAERHPEFSFMGVIGGYEEDKHIFRHDLPNVTFHPHTRNIEDFYGQTSILLAPSIYESYGRVCVEAMRYGIPCITSDTPGLRECIGGYGFNLPRTKLDDWSTAIRSVFLEYDAFKETSKDRYQQLLEQSQEELALFVKTMEGLANGSYNSGGR